MRQESDTADRRVAEVAARQYGVAATTQLLAAGLGHNAIRRRIESGRLHRVHRGVYAIGYPRSGREGAWMAAVLACGSVAIGLSAPRSVLDVWGAAVSHRSAAELWELLPQRDGRVDVSLAGTPGRRSRQGVHIHRSRTLTSELVTLRAGIPLTTVARTLADLRRSPTTRGCPARVTPRELRSAEREAAVLGLRLDESGPGDRTRSDLERDFLELCRRHGLPRPEVNVQVGRYLVDFLWRERRLVVETDSYRYHRGRVAFADDHARDLAFRELGHDLIRVDERQLETEPARIARLLRRELQPATGVG
jgi:very-short-patch-repair endonuclease/predicted transcriptional regulator of viral defense system